MPINSPFLYYGGRFIDKIAVASELGTVRPDERITLTLDADSSIAMDFADAETLVLQMVERLYDKGALSMEAAERLTFLGNSVLADAQARETCAVCGQPDNCGDCDHTPVEKCGEPLSWNGPGTHPCVRPKGHEGEHTRFGGIYPLDPSLINNGFDADTEVD